MKEKSILFFLFVLFSAKAWPQSASQDIERFNFGQPDSTFSLIREAPITIDFEEEEEEAEKEKKKSSKKKRKKKVFYGVKTKKGFTRRGYGNNVTLDLFYYLKQPPKQIDPYIQDIYWYDTKQKKIKSTSFDPRKGYILHGPYKQLAGDEVVEEGIFYFGTKHGRWTQFSKDGTLLDKRKYHKGWPKDAIVKFYDADQKKLKEVIPVVYDVKEGDYYYFHENGMIAIRGTYKENKKVGRWVEYYPFLNRAKKEIIYPSNPYEETPPYINREWNRRGQVVYQKKVQ